MKFQAGYVKAECGSWLGHYSKWPIDPLTGQKKRRQVAFKIGPLTKMSKTQARQKLQERIAQELGITADSRASLKWFAEFRWKPMREGTWRESTKQTNEELLKMIYERFGTLALEDVDGVQLQQWLNALAKQRSGSVVRHLRIFLKSILKEATEQGHMRHDPARALRVPRLKTVRRDYLTEPEITALLKNTRFFPRERALLTLALVTALRPSELLALRWSCFSADYSMLTIRETVYRGTLRPFTKTTEENDTEFVTQFVPKTVAEAMEDWNRDTKYNKPKDFVFANESGGCWWKENYQRRVLNELAERSGVKHFNFQMLRRSFATHAQGLGSPKDLAVMMRHRKVDTAQQNYVQEVQESVRKATEALATALLG
jgi:integrase